MMKICLKKILLFAVLIYLASCANQGFPPGGPEDRTPPQIVMTFPKTDGLMVALDAHVAIQFSEKLDSRTVQNAVFISPNPGEGVEIKTKGSRIVIQFPGLLIKDVTYTITLGSGIKDLRGNGMKESYTLAFSTGEKLDRNEIRGRVFAEKPEEVMVWAYFLTAGDTVDPSLRQPQYITQCNANGSFHFRNLAPRKYRLFAVVDRIRNRTYQANQELIGVTTSDIDLTADSVIVTDKYFRLTKVDTSEVRILQVNQPDRSHLRVRFSRPVFLFSNFHDAVELKDHSANYMAILDLVINRENADDWALTTAPRDTGKYELVFYNLMDQHKKIVADTLNTLFSSIVTPDTSRPMLVTTFPPDSTQSVPLDSAFRFVFSESIDTSDFRPLIPFFADSARIDTFRLKWENLSELSIYPRLAWLGLQRYSCRLDTANIKDLAGNSIRLHKFIYTWRTLDPDTLSAISGKIFDEDTTATGKIFLELWNKGGQKPYNRIAIPDTGFYSFANILPGEYVVQGFRDSDGNGIYSYGNVLPFEPAERFFVAPDTILVRSRWPNEGNNYALQK